jgi:hypothetical protein
MFAKPCSPAFLDIRFLEILSISFLLFFFCVVGIGVGIYGSSFFFLVVVTRFVLHCSWSVGFDWEWRFQIWCACNKITVVIAHTHTHTLLYKYSDTYTVQLAMIFQMSVSD